MITPEEIVKKAKRKYRDVLCGQLSGETIFPLTFPVGRLSNTLSERRQQIETLRDKSAEVIGQGYTIETQEVNKRDLGRQTIPKQIVIPDLDNYLALIRKRTEFNGFVDDAAKIQQKFPQLADWLVSRPQDVIACHGDWDDLLTVCDYFVKHPRPGMFIRELPIPVHTKFIERNQRILRDLLDLLLPSKAITTDETDFTRRYGLRDKPPLVRVRLLEEQLDWVRLDDLSLPVDQLAHLLSQHVKPRHVIIVENQINFLTVPKHPNSVTLFGGGFGVHLLRDVDWLAQCDVIYWGDMDAHGFQMLSDVRGMFPHTRSVMMDMQTLTDNEAYVGEGTAAPHVQYDHLTEAEAQIAAHLLEHNRRLEQEHIPHEYAVVRLKQVLQAP